MMTVDTVQYHHQYMGLCAEQVNSTCVCIKGLKRGRPHFLFVFVLTIEWITLQGDRCFFVAVCQHLFEESRPLKEKVDFIMCK